VAENRLREQREVEVYVTCVCGDERIVWPDEHLNAVTCYSCGRDHDHLTQA
jgi:ribosomal protein S27E